VNALGIVRQVTVHQVEGRIEHCVPKTFQGSSALEYANLWLQLISERAPADGSYYKTEVEVVFADGTTARTRHKVKRGDTDGTVMEHMIRWAEYVLARADLHLLTPEEETSMRCILANAQAAREKEVE
jgi:hypothetical protein